MSESRYLSTVEVSHILGVSVTTVKRWTDEGVLPAHKTAGGHRKILRAALAELLRSGQLPCVSVLESAGTVVQDLDALAEQLHAALMDDDLTTTRRLLDDALDAGHVIASLADHVVRPALTRVGLDWERAAIDVYREHRCSQVCLLALHQIRPRFETLAHTDAPLTLGGCPAGDHYQIATLLAEMVALECGWRTVHLGPNTPLAEFRKALDVYHPRLLWLSISHLAESDEFLREFQPFASLCQQRGLTVLVGGQALTENLRGQLPHATFGTGLTDLATLAQSLVPRPALAG